jgi:RNA polymerase sigma-70 factor (ECF subfamily)
VVRELRPGYADWDELYLDNVVWVYRLLFGKVGNRHDAEDLCTEVFLAALRPLRLDVSKAEVRGYLTATARTVLSKYWRDRLGVEVTVIDDAVVAAVEDSPPAASDAPLRAEQALAGLSARHRQILELRFLHGRSIKEAALVMGVTVANAKVLQHRALRMAAKAREGGEGG